jgi:hypothetical protein
MSAHTSEQSFQYIGILNGVMYRIDPSSGRSLEPLPGSQPFRQQPDRPVDGLSSHFDAPVPVVRPAPAAPASPVAETVSIAVAVTPSNLFHRSGAEPLRAGHPDLWALLVAGTCLEGTSFKSE